MLVYDYNMIVSKTTFNNWQRLGHINSLTSRANKLQSKNTFLPTEKIKNIPKFKKFINILNSFNLDIEEKLFISAITIIKPKKDTQLYKEIYSLKNVKYNKKFDELKKFNFDEEIDFLGSIYQSLKLEGKKSEEGSYYTPNNLLNIDIKENDKVLDPCCGSGQFLIYFLKFTKPENIYGYDMDEIAVKLARINLLFYSKKEFEPNIFYLDFLTSKIDKKFDVIATNPPWGAYFDDKYKKILKTIYPKISSYESFSYFIFKSLDILKDNGILDFILPYSIINVQTHKDIRNIILKYNILELKDLKHPFKGVMSRVIRLKLEKKVGYKSFEYFLLNKTEKNILNKIEKFNNFLEAEFGLGIVTGNNKKHLTKNPKNLFYEKIYRGKNIDNFFIKDNDEYILFNKKQFQQSLEYEKYKREKLIYKFISKKLVIAYDKEGILTLNSANFFIPKNYNIFFILGIFNSKLYNFYFQKKFSSIKVLKQHLSSIPLPKEDENIINIVKQILLNKKNINILDEYIFEKFEITQKERNIICEY